ncbi:hypothetical protein H0H93_009829 [Arthromyces matolae]|nr:hypothetical protein H0H93_009829 [Arthromyces matolae]
MTGSRLGHPEGPRTRTSIENGHETIEILSSSDSDAELPGLEVSMDDNADDNVSMDDDAEYSEIAGGSSDWGMLTPSDDEDDTWTSEPGTEMLGTSDVEDEESEVEHRKPSSTVWLDPDVQSEISLRRRKLNRQLEVEQVEYVSGLPSYWPIPHVKTAYIVDLVDSKYDHLVKGQLLSADALIKNKDQDSWTGGTGAGARDSKPKFDIFTGEAIPCRRSHLQCAGYHACAKIDPKLLSFERYELDPSSLEAVVAAQIKSRNEEANSAEKIALIFWHVIHAHTCGARDDNGGHCTGQPIMKPRKTPTFHVGHYTCSIPDNVDETLLAKLFNNEILEGFSSAASCSRIIPAHIGGKAAKCRYPHNADGKPSPVIRHKCPASRVIYIPLDPKIRMACIVPNHGVAHNHPILPAIKPSREIKELFKRCIDAVGVIGATVQSVERAPSTPLLLEGMNPITSNPAFQNVRMKQDMIRDRKKHLFPNGTGIAADRRKPMAERYVHNIVCVSPNDGMLIFTFQPYLLNFIHEAKTLFIDTTFKRTAGDLKEIEMAMWLDSVQRARTIGRIYSDRADEAQYTTLFDEIQKLVKSITRKPLLLKRLSKAGTLICFNVDLELAQVLGIGNSFAVTNEPDHSKIPNNTPIAELVQFFVRGCYVHVKRGIEELRKHVTKEEFDRIHNFMYLKTPRDVEDFNVWIKTLNVKEVNDWWAHKVNNKWILPSVIQCLTKLTDEDWATTQSTTNIVESQHHWTNGRTGIKLSLLEAILTARKLDEDVANEIQTSLKSGVLRNPRNDTFNRMSRSIARNNAAYNKAKDTQERNDKLSSINEEIDMLTQAQKGTREQLKIAKALKKELSVSTGRTRGYRAESSSSGRVSSTPGIKAARKTAAVPYPMERSGSVASTLPQSTPVYDNTTTRPTLASQVTTDSAPASNTSVIDDIAIPFPDNDLSSFGPTDYLYEDIMLPSPLHPIHEFQQAQGAASSSDNMESILAASEEVFNSFFGLYGEEEAN